MSNDSPTAIEELKMTQAQKVFFISGADAEIKVWAGAHRSNLIRMRSMLL